MLISPYQPAKWQCWRAAEEQMLLSFNLVKPARWLNRPTQTWRKSTAGFTAHWGNILMCISASPGKEVPSCHSANLQVHVNDHCYSAVGWSENTKCQVTGTIKMTFQPVLTYHQAPVSMCSVVIHICSDPWDTCTIITCLHQDPACHISILPHFWDRTR